MAESTPATVQNFGPWTQLSFLQEPDGIATGARVMPNRQGNQREIRLKDLAPASGPPKAAVVTSAHMSENHHADKHHAKEHHAETHHANQQGGQQHAADHGGHNAHGHGGEAHHEGEKHAQEHRKDKHHVKGDHSADHGGQDSHGHGGHAHHQPDESMVCETRMGHQSHQIAHWCHTASIVILSFFMVEILGKMWVNTKAFFKNPIEVLDLIVVSVSLFVDVFVVPMIQDPEQKGNVELLMVLLICCRFWRIVRIFHGVFEVVHHQQEHQEKMHDQLEALAEEISKLTRESKEEILERIAEQQENKEEP